MTDPGVFTTAQGNVTGLDAIVITHEHADHYEPNMLKDILKNNPDAEVIVSTSLGKTLEKEGIVHLVVGDGQEVQVRGVSVRGFGKAHAFVYEKKPDMENTGYLIDNAFFLPGDSFEQPKASVDILALPVCGPWMKLGEALDFAIAVKPRVAFPVHDHLYRPEIAEMFEGWPTQVFSEKGIEFVALKAGETKTF